MFFVFVTPATLQTAAFYGRLGYNPQFERHGEQGQLHMAMALPETLVEIYPTMKELQGNLFFIGIETAEDPGRLKQELIESFGGQEMEPPVPVSRKGIATLRDPAGMVVRLMPGKG